MDSRPRYRSTLAFTDLLFNVLIGFAFMFIVAFILINPVEKDAEIEAKAEFMIIMEWDDQSHYDIDLWMQDPVGNIVGFPNMHAGLLHLDKDDLGQSNDTVILADGSTKVIYLNREVMTIRGIVPGEYIVNNHLYSMKGQKGRGPMEVTTKIIKLNPYSEVHTGVVILPHHGAEETVLRFTISPTGFVKSKNKRQKRFAGKRQHGGTMTSAGSTSALPDVPPSGTSERVGVAPPDDVVVDTFEHDRREQADDDEVHISADHYDSTPNNSGTEQSHYNPGAGMAPSSAYPEVDARAREIDNRKEEEERGRYADPAMGGF